MQKRRIVLLGSSIILSTVGMSLRDLPEYEVVSRLLEQQDDVKTMKPDVVLFDLEAARPDSAFSLLESQPDLILVGLSPDTNLVRIWSGEQLRELCTKDLIEIIGDRSRSVFNEVYESIENER